MYADDAVFTEDISNDSFMQFIATTFGDYIQEIK